MSTIFDFATSTNVSKNPGRSVKKSEGNTMHHRPSSLVSTVSVFFRRFIIHTHFALLVLFVMGSSSVQAASQTTHSSKVVAACTQKRVPISARPLQPYYPSHVRGDADFGEHGPSVTVAAKLKQGDEFTPSLGGRSFLDVQMYMRAQETRSDWTEARTTETDQRGKTQRIYTAAWGWEIASVTPGHFDSNGYLDTDHNPDRLPAGDSDSLNPSFVDHYMVVGDTVGSEAGTKTRVTVYTRQITVTLQPWGCQ